MLTGLIARHRRYMENRLARTGLLGPYGILYHDVYAGKRACSTSSHLTTEVGIRTTRQGTADQLRALFAASEPPDKRGCRNGGGAAIFVAPAQPPSIVDD